MLFRVLVEGNEQRTGSISRRTRACGMPSSAVHAGARTQRTVSNFTTSWRLKEPYTAGHRRAVRIPLRQRRDTLPFSHFQTFNFHAGTDAPEVPGPLLFYVLHRASNEIADPQKLATFKIFLLDEAWLFIKNETIRNYGGAGAEDLAQAQRRHDPGDAIHQRA